MKTLKFYKFRDVKSPVRANRKDSGYDVFIPNKVSDLLELENCVYTPKESISQENQKWFKEQFIDTEKNTISIPFWFWLLIPTWVSFVLPDTDNENSTYDLVFHNKSWVSTKYNLVVWASVVDNEYRWEVHIHLINAWPNDVVLEWWQKIVQCILREVFTYDTEEISKEEFEKHLDTDRWTGWFWSTWTK